MITNYNTKERIEQLEKLAPFRKKALKDLTKMHRKSIDKNTVILIK